MSAPKSLREQISSGKMVIAPGAYDCITARLIEQAGFPAVYMTGAGTSATLGYPDYGLVTMSEMVGNASRIAASINLPLISDADTGYGNELNMYRTVREFERAGVTAIHVEDQVFPKKCGHLDNKELVSLEDYLAKIRAAVAARRSRDFLIIARTDSRAMEGFDAAVKRSKAAVEAGADMVFLEAPQTMSEIEQVPKLIKAPCLLNVVRNGKSPDMDLVAAEKMGYALAIMPGLLISAVVGISDQLLAEVKKTGKHPPTPGDAGPAQVFARFGAAEWDDRRTAFRPEAGKRVAAE